MYSTGLFRCGGRLARGFGVGSLMLLWITGCDGLDDLLDVETPGQVVASTLEDPSNADLIVHMAVTDFECALDDYIVSTGAMGDEFADAQLASAAWGYDRRDADPSRSDGAWVANDCEGSRPGLYQTLSTARWQADHALELLHGWTDEQVPARTRLIAEAAAYAGYSLVLLGESMCTAAIDLGRELSPGELNELAEERFAVSASAAENSGAAEILDLARVGQARARLNLGDVAGAADVARLVSPGFTFMAEYSNTTDRQRNRVFTANNRDGFFSIEDDFWSLEVSGEPDPRVLVVDEGRTGSDQVTSLYTQRKYPTSDSPIPMARWEEAQLIIAEAELGQVAVGIINDLRTRAGLPAFSSSDPEEIRLQVIEERSRELFLEGHHLGDKIRYDLPFTPSAGEPYPAKAGGVYGSNTCMPLPNREKDNNPNM